jgi:hypothetical protein
MRQSFARHPRILPKCGPERKQAETEGCHPDGSRVITFFLAILSGDANIPVIGILLGKDESWSFSRDSWRALV